MIDKTDAFKNAWMAGNQKYILLEFSDGTTLDDESVLLESFDLDEELCSAEQIVFGATSSACFRISVLGTSKRYTGLTVRPTIAAVDEENNYYLMPFGEYLIESDTRSDDMTYRNLVAYDKLHGILGTNYELFYNNFFETHNNPTIKTFRDAFFEYVGLTQEAATLINDNVVISQTKVSSYSGSDIIRSICEPNGCFGFINYDGKWQYSFPTQKKGLYPSDDLYPSNNLYPRDAADVVFDEGNVDASPILGGVAFEEYTTDKITQVRYHDTIVGTDGNCYRLSENNLLNGLDDSALSSVLNAFLSFTNDFFYTPGSIKGRARPWAQLGDTVGVMVDGSGFVSFPILRRSMSGITAIYDTFSATGIENFKYSENDYESYVDSAIEDSVESTTELMETLQKELSSTVSGSMDVWATAGIGISYTGFGAPTLETYETEEWNATTDEVGYGNPSIIGYESTDDGLTYLNEETGGIWTLTTTGGKQWTCTGQASKVSTTHYNYEQSDVGKKYLDEEDGKVYVLESYTESGQTKYRWTYSTQLEKVSAQLNSRITQTAQEISTEVSQTYETKSAASSQYANLSSNISQTAQGILTTVSETYETQSAASSQYSSLSSSIEQTAHSIDMSVSNNYSTAGITITIKDANGNTIDTGTGTINMTGLVTFSNNSYATTSQAQSYANSAESSAKNYADTTTIDGGRIKTGTISADRIDTDNLVAKKLAATSGTIAGIDIASNKLSFMSGLYSISNGGVIVCNSISADNYGNFGGDVTSASLITDEIIGKGAAKYDKLLFKTNISNNVQLRIGEDKSGELIQSNTIYNRTYAYAANMYITVEGTLGRATSSSKRYKNHITYFSDNKDILSEAVAMAKNLHPCIYRYNEGYVTGEEVGGGKYNDGRYQIGLIAEDVEDTIGSYATTYIKEDDEIKVENWSDRPVLVLTLALSQQNERTIQKQQARIDALETEVAELKQLVHELLRKEQR